jgi:hypothetical protein
MDSVEQWAFDILRHSINPATHTDSIEPFRMSNAHLLTESMDVTWSSRISWLVCGRTLWRVIVLRNFLSIERGPFTVNVTSCVESVPACVHCTGGGPISATAVIPTYVTFFYLRFPANNKSIIFNLHSCAHQCPSPKKTRWPSTMTAAMNFLQLFLLFNERLPQQQLSN